MREGGKDVHRAERKREQLELVKEDAVTMTLMQQQQQQRQTRSEMIHSM